MHESSRTADATVLPIVELSQVGEARRLATALSDRIGFDETIAGKVAIVASEAASNLAKHATQGELVLQALGHRGRGIEIMALDKGPGMRNVSNCLRDGDSSTGTLGTGFGAIRRLSTVFDVYSIPGVGTALLSRLLPERVPSNSQPSSLEIGALCLPVPCEKHPGDGWAVIERPDRTVVVVTDGLGHGPKAAEASQQALRVFEDNPDLLAQST